MPYIGYKMSAAKLDDLNLPDDNTDLNASTTRHGLLSKLPGGTTTFLRGDGTWATIIAGALPGNVSYKDAIETFTAKKTFQIDDNDSIFVVERAVATAINSRAGIRFDLRDSANNLITGAGYLFFQTIDNTVGSTDFGFKIFNRRNGSSTELFKISELGKLSIGTNLRLEIDDTGLTGIRLFAFPDAAGKVVTEAFAATITNKVLDSMTNTFNNVVLWNRKERYGKISMSSTNAFGEGRLQDIQEYGDFAASDVDATGYYRYINTPNAVDGVAGYAKFHNVLASYRRDKNPRAVWMQQQAVSNYPRANQRLYFGFSSVQGLLPNSNTPLAAGDSGFIIGYRIGDTNYQLFVNDASGAVTPTDTGVVIPTVSTIHELEILMSATDITWTIRTFNYTLVATGSVTVKIPALTTKLYLSCLLQTSTAQAIGILTRNVEVKTQG
jgi:hypothetical protein